MCVCESGYQLDTYGNICEVHTQITSAQHCGWNHDCSLIGKSQCINGNKVISKVNLNKLQAFRYCSRVIIEFYRIIKADISQIISPTSTYSSTGNL